MQKLKTVICCLLLSNIGCSVKCFIQKTDFCYEIEHNPCTHSKITDDAPGITTFILECDSKGNIILLCDGKKTPLILSSIPYKEQHLTEIQKAYNLECEHIGIFSLNEIWELYVSGFLQVYKKNLHVKHFYYPTKDYTAPLFIDMLRAVYDLEHRDEYGLDFALVHCKAGRARSATIIVAYLVMVLHQNNQLVHIEKIINYVRSHRHCIAITKAQKQAIMYFYQELKSAGSLEKLYELHRDQIEERNIEILQLFNIFPLDTDLDSHPS